MASMPPTSTLARDERRLQRRTTELSTAELVCLSLVVQRVSHGWALGTLLLPDGEIGRVWSLSRPLTYRAIEGLVDKHLVTRQEQVTGHGRDRLLLTATAAGRRMARQWLDSPVEHLRDVRTELLVKLCLRDRVGLDATDLLVRQRERFEPVIEALTSADEGDSVVALWRRESASAVRRFLDRALEPIGRAEATKSDLRLSARNQLQATVASVHRGEVMASVKATLGNGQTLTATITREAIDDLDLAAGDAVVMIVKATEVIVAKSE